MANNRNPKNLTVRKREGQTANLFSFLALRRGKREDELIEKCIFEYGIQVFFTHEKMDSLPIPAFAALMLLTRFLFTSFSVFFLFPNDFLIPHALPSVLFYVSLYSFNTFLFILLV